MFGEDDLFFIQKIKLYIRNKRFHKMKEMEETISQGKTKKFMEKIVSSTKGFQKYFGFHFSYF